LHLSDRHRLLPGDHCVKDRRTPNAVRGTDADRREPRAQSHGDEKPADRDEGASASGHVDDISADAADVAVAPPRHVDEKPMRQGRPPKYHTAGERVAAERQRKAAWARARRRAGLLKESAEVLRQRQRRHRARLRADSEVHE
jgi:hypothetical protein